jgi:anti-anti-sigma factor
MNFFRYRFDRRHLPTPPTGAVRVFESGVTSRDRLTLASSNDEHTSVVRWQHDQATLNLSTERIRSWNHAHELGRQLLNLLEDANVRVLRVDLGCIECISSETLTQLVRAHCRASQLGKQLVLENVTKSVREVLNVTRLDRLFGFVDMEQDGDRLSRSVYTH